MEIEKEIPVESGELKGRFPDFSNGREGRKLTRGDFFFFSFGIWILGFGQI